MFAACLPFGPWVTSKLTFWPSLRLLNPGILIAEKCANRSSPPPSGVMKPKPFASLNHFTVPVAISEFPQEQKNRDEPGQCFDLKESTENDSVTVEQIVLYCLKQKHFYKSTRFGPKMPANPNRGVPA